MLVLAFDVNSKVSLNCTFFLLNAHYCKLSNFLSGTYYDQFCLDIAVDFCESPVPELRVIINDEELYNQGISTMFGSTSHEGPKMVGNLICILGTIMASPKQMAQLVNYMGIILENNLELSSSRLFKASWFELEKIL